MIPDPHEPHSAYTGLAAFPAVGLIAASLVGSPEAWVVAATMAVLGLATAWFHWVPEEERDDERDADHAAMNANYLALAAFAAGVSWQGVLAAAAFGFFGLELIADLKNYALMGGTVVLTTLVGIEAGETALSVAGLLSFALSFVLWQIKEPAVVFGRRIDPDLTHGQGWHNLAALGTGMLILSVAGGF